MSDLQNTITLTMNTTCTAAGFHLTGYSVLKPMNGCSITVNITLKKQQQKQFRSPLIKVPVSTHEHPQSTHLRLFQKLLLIDFTQALFTFLLVENRSLAVSGHLVGWSSFSLNVVPCLQVHTAVSISAINSNFNSLDIHQQQHFQCLANYYSHSNKLC